MPGVITQIRKITTVQPDLQGLELTKGEIRHLSAIGVDAIFNPPTLRKFVWEIIKTFGVIGLLASSSLLLGYFFPRDLLLIVSVHTAAAGWLLFHDIKKIVRSQKSQNFIKLLDDVKQYNSVIKAIDINDQIEAAGNPGVRIQDREKVIEALKLTREDLCRALKTERILRENEHFIQINPQLFANNLTALTALQVSDLASDRGRLLNEALKIAVGVQAEMRQLQDKHSNS